MKLILLFALLVLCSKLSAQTMRKSLIYQPNEDTSYTIDSIDTNIYQVRKETKDTTIVRYCGRLRYEQFLTWIEFTNRNMDNTFKHLMYKERPAPLYIKSNFKEECYGDSGNRRTITRYYKE